jgi:hypothetical protein
VNDPKWADEFAGWATRKAKSMGMDPIEMMGRALGLKKEADEWRARQKRNRDIEADGNKIYGKATTLRADCSKCSWVGTFYGEPHEAEKRITDAHAAARHGNCNGILTLTPSVPPNDQAEPQPGSESGARKERQ